MALKIKVYQAQKKTNIYKLLSSSLKDVYEFRFLSKQLAIRDLKGQYRQSYLGFFWVFATPLVTAVVWIVLNKSGTIKLTETGMPYPLYAFSGTLIWSILVDAIQSPTISTNAAKAILSKINFPKEALVISGIYKLLFNTGVKLLLLLFFVIYFGVGLTGSIWLLPLALIGTILCGTAMGLLLAPLGLLYTDVGRAVKFGMQFMMYLTPVVYVMPKEGLIKTFMEWNPLTPLLVTSRDIIVGAPLEQLNQFLWVTGACIPLFLIALVFYRLAMPIIIERLSA